MIIWLVETGLYTMEVRQDCVWYWRFYVDQCVFDFSPDEIGYTVEFIRETARLMDCNVAIQLPGAVLFIA